MDENFKPPQEGKCLLRLTPDECQMLSNFIEEWKYEEKEEVRQFVEKVQTTLQDFF